jgi:hypothetical protein
MFAKRNAARFAINTFPSHPRLRAAWLDTQGKTFTLRIIE